MHHMEGHLSRPVMCQPLLRTVFRIHQIGMIARLIHHRLNTHEVRDNFVLPRVDEVVDTHDHPLRNRVDPSCNCRNSPKSQQPKSSAFTLSAPQNSTCR